MTATASEVKRRLFILKYSGSVNVCRSARTDRQKNGYERGHEKERKKEIREMHEGEEANRKRNSDGRMELI